MPFFEGIEENFRFLILEVTRQVEYSKACMKNPSVCQSEKAEARDDYVDNLKTAIEKKAFERLLSINPQDNKQIDLMRALIAVATNLERLADFAVNVVNQTGYLHDTDFLNRYDYQPFFKQILRGLSRTEDALFKRDINLALDICRVEDRTDRIYKELFDRIMGELKTGNETENLVTALFVFRYLERMGDSMLNIGEAIIYATVGEKLKIDHFDSVRESFLPVESEQQNAQDDVEDNGKDNEKDNASFNMSSMGETKSGSRIGRIQHRSIKEGEKGVIYKEGRTKKIKQEKMNIERWDALVPGIPPRVFGFAEEQETAYLLLEFLEGTTIQNLILNGNESLLRQALEGMFATLRAVWNQTRQDQPVHIDYLEQLSVRAAEIYSVHPSFKKPHYLLDRGENLTMEQMANLLLPHEQANPAPFSVFIHGDFNNDNVIFNAVEDRIHYIDLNRSRQSDYVQDAAVFIVSNFRMPFFDSLIRRKLDSVSVDMFRFARAFAEEQNDESFDARMTLALIRSFVTSTRFILHRDLSRAMYHRAMYLMERLIHHGETENAINKFELKEDIIIY